MSQDTNQLVNEYCMKYAEWAEQLGDNFPQFLVHKLASDLIKQKNKTEYLEKIAYVTYTK